LHPLPFFDRSGSGKWPKKKLKTLDEKLTKNTIFFQLLLCLCLYFSSIMSFIFKNVQFLIFVKQFSFSIFHSFWLFVFPTLALNER
jgi:hypothetical protein